MSKLSKILKIDYWKAEQHLMFNVCEYHKVRDEFPLKHMPGCDVPCELTNIVHRKFGLVSQEISAKFRTLWMLR